MFDCLVNFDSSALFVVISRLLLYILCLFYVAVLKSDFCRMPQRISLIYEKSEMVGKVEDEN